MAIDLAVLGLALDHLVAGVDGHLVQRGGHLEDLEGGQEAVVDAVLEGVDVERVAEVGVGVGVLGALGGGGEAQLHGRGEVFKDAPPVALVVGSAAVALVDDDQVEVVPRIGAEGEGLRLALGGLGHEGLEDRKEHRRVHRRLSVVIHGLGLDPDQRAGLKDVEGGEVLEGLAGESVTVGEEEDPRLALGLLGEAPAGLVELPDDLGGDGRLARAGGQRQQQALAAGGDGVEHRVDGALLVIAKGPLSALIGPMGGREIVADLVTVRVGHRPELVRGREGHRHIAFLARLHVDQVKSVTVGRVGIAQAQHLGVLLGLGQAFRDAFFVRLRLDHRQLAAAVAKDEVGDLLLATTPHAHEAAGRDMELAVDLGALDDAPAGGSQ